MILYSTHLTGSLGSKILFVKSIYGQRYFSAHHSLTGSLIWGGGSQFGDVKWSRMGEHRFYLSGLGYGQV